MNRVGLALLAAAAVLSSGCRTVLPASPSVSPPETVAPAAAPATPPAPPVSRAAVSRTGYTIQVGAFSVVANARRLTEALLAKGLDAFYFPQGAGLYKVRFGDFTSRAAAAQEADRLHAEAFIGDYFIVAPEDYAVYRLGPTGEDLRDKLVATAESFIGVEYSWGGTSSREGFDCSGLVRAVYQLNGLNLPRSLFDQYDAGTSVPKDRLSKGDLVFFTASPGGRLSHVGIYIGGNSFIHAPGTGKTVREASLDSDYFREHFSGARAYLK